ncbi:MAG: hypothetical protein KDD22_02150, partial [Bdellovibrionales bacterium]|nr:hypothetical protein [Bdellovibrionales bacterium]
MKTTARNLIKSSLLLSLVMIFVTGGVGCKRNQRNSLNGTSSGERGTSDTGGTGPSAPGTSDSGGGTGVDGKVFESYAINPLELDAYKTHLKPLFDNLQYPDKESSEPGLHAIFMMKTWYVAPVELNRIQKDILGISFVQSETQQIARQTSDEIWIDKKIFDQMNSKDQADLLLHEYMMNLYMMKFMTWEEICNKSAKFIKPDDENNGCQTSTNKKFLEKFLKPEEHRQLNDQDNQNIRSATAWFWKNAIKPLKTKDFYKLLFASGFDKRFFNPVNAFPEENLPVEISKQTFLSALEAGKYTGKGPGFCKGLNTNLQSTCNFSVTEELSDDPSVSWKNLRVKLEVDGKSVIDFTTI